MAFLTVDFETYYDKEYSLKKLTTEEYLNDPRFEIMGVGVKVDEQPTDWFSGTHEEVRQYLLRKGIEDSAVLCHNTLFDGAILEWKLGLKAKYYYDTLCMGRALHGLSVGGSLAKLAKHYGLGEKGTTVGDMIGRRRESLAPYELESYGVYCMNDVDLTLELFKQMGAMYPEDEFDLIDMTVKMYFRPQFMVDDAILNERLTGIQTEQREVLDKLKEILKTDDHEVIRKSLSSSKKFAGILEQFGAIVPYKLSPAGKLIPALAKNDEAFVALSEDGSPEVQALCAARLNVRSTIEATRVMRFIGVGQRNRGWMPVPLKYYGAHTGRWSGLDQINFQNLPSRDPKKKALKNAIIAPPDHVVINCDSSQIEARKLAWLTGQSDLVQLFAERRDPYCDFATRVYGRVITKADQIERFVGKTCILGLGYGTGAEKLRTTLKMTPPGADFSIEACKGFVDSYRTINNRIVAFWDTCDRALRQMLAGFGDFYLDERGVIKVVSDGLLLPNGMKIKYPGLYFDSIERRMMYVGRYGSVPIWGGSVTENVVQALARIIVGQQLLAINKHYPVALTVHDSGVWVVHKKEAPRAVALIHEMMSSAPSWCPDMPLDCEISVGPSYGECEKVSNPYDYQVVV